MSMVIYCYSAVDTHLGSSIEGGIPSLLVKVRIHALCEVDHFVGSPNQNLGRTFSSNVPGLSGVVSLVYLCCNI